MILRLSKLEQELGACELLLQKAAGLAAHAASPQSRAYWRAKANGLRVMIRELKERMKEGRA